ncbi:Protein C18B2.1, partial [Aphelenchoides avenae]
MHLLQVLPTRSHFGTINSSSICTEKDAVRCVKKFKNLETRLRVASKYRLMACLIQKNMSTLLQAIMCFLHNEEAFKKSGRVFSRESTDVRFCRDRNEYNYVRIVEKAFGITRNTTASWKYLAVVRDPIDRFLSAYVDKCIRKPYAPKYCNDCGANMTCFVMREYDRIMKQASIKWMARTFEDRHFFPQS